MSSAKNKVILFGGNNHNGLGLVRSFGRHGIRAYGILIGDEAKESYVACSKYWKKVWKVDTEEQALDIIMKNFSHEEEKPLLIPWSETAAEYVDLNLDRLLPYFIVPSMNKKQGALVELMDKEKQIDFTAKLGLKMLPQQLVMLDEIDKYTIDFPTFLKPLNSFEGSKDDMCICNNQQELMDAVEKLKAKGLTRMLAQEYLGERKEYTVTGGISDKRYSFSVARHIRQWPNNYGNGSYSETVTDKKVLRFSADMLKKIQQAGYRGTIDCGLFENSKGELFVNEINWRSSGRNFVSKNTGVESAYMYYCDMTGQPFDGKRIGCVHYYCMIDYYDIKHVLNKDITPVKFLDDLMKTRCFAVWDITDLKPAFKRYSIMVRQLLKGGK